ncbi:MAG: MFS transporter [Myxococcales bacterium]|nr:MFS transporter [Myxococcales bacterium]
MLAVLCFCFAAVALDNTKLYAALPTLARAWALGPIAQSWIAPANLVVYVSLLILGGSLGERFGARPVLFWGLCIFGGASLAAAMARSACTLIAARMGVGLGAALMTPATLATIKHTFDEGERPRAVALWTASFGVAAAAGPVLAGVLLERWGWRSVLLANVPVAAAALVAGRALVPAGLPRLEVPFDGAGAALSFAATSALVFAILRGPWLGWLRADVLGAIATAGVASALLVRRERRARHPMLDPALFRHPRFRRALVLILLSYLAYAGVTFVLAQYLQIGRARSPTEAGILSVPLPASMLVGTLCAPLLLARAGLDRALALSLGAAAAGAILLVAAAVRGDGALLGAGQALLGAGCGGAFANATEMVMAAVPLERAGSAAGINETTFEFAGVLGIAVMSALLGWPAASASSAAEQGAAAPAGVAADAAVRAAMVEGAARALAVAAAAIVVAAAIAAMAAIAAATAARVPRAVRDAKSGPRPPA